MGPFASSKEHEQRHKSSSRKEEKHHGYDEKKVEDHSHAREAEKLTGKFSSPPSDLPAENQQIKKQDSSSSSDKKNDNSILPLQQQQKLEKGAPSASSPASSGTSAPPALQAAPNAPAAPQQPQQQLPSIDDNAPVEGMVEMGGGLPALPPRPVAPQRQQSLQASSTSGPEGGMAMRVPQIKAADAKPQMTIPPGSDLGVVGKIGVFQIAHAPHAAEKSAAAAIVRESNLLMLWVYIMTFFVTFVLIKRK